MVELSEKIRQELYAHFVMITISRLFANQSEIEKILDS